MAYGTAVTMSRIPKIHTVRPYSFRAEYAMAKRTITNATTPMTQESSSLRRRLLRSGSTTVTPMSLDMPRSDTADGGRSTT